MCFNKLNADVLTAHLMYAPNSTTRTSATGVLHNTTNGRAHNNSTTCCTTNAPHRNARAQHLDMSRCWDVANFCPLVLSTSGSKLLFVAVCGVVSTVLIVRQWLNSSVTVMTISSKMFSTMGITFCTNYSQNDQLMTIT